jgi:cytochrome c553
LRTLPRFATICLLGAAISALLSACSSTDPTPAAPGDSIARGEAIWLNKKVDCGSCHGADAKGYYGPNITNSATAGIGTWTLAQFTGAVRDGKDENGAPLCPSMLTFTKAEIDDAQMSDLFAYIKSKPVSDVVASDFLLCD